MATVYGATIKSTWRSYLTYSVEETPTTYKVTVDNAGIDLTSTYVVGFADHAHKGTLTVGANSDYFTDATDYTKDTSLISNYSTGLRTLVIQKTASTQTVKLSFSLYFQDWIKWNKSMTDGTGYGASTSTASVTLTVPALAKPAVSLSALRSSDVDTTAVFTATVSGFSSDVISSVVLTVGDTTYSLGSGTIGSSGVLTFTKTIIGLSINRVQATLVATGSGGASDTYVYYLTSAFYTMDIGGKGKEIAFGCPATDENLPDAGLFRCAMETAFEKDICTSGNVHSAEGKLAAEQKIRNIFCSAHSIPITVTNGTFTNNGTTAYLVGNTLRLYMGCTANAAKTAGNIANEVMLTIKINDPKIAGMYSEATSGASSGPNSQIHFGVSRDTDDAILIKPTLAAIAQNIAKGGAVNAYVGLPCVLNWDAF